MSGRSIGRRPRRSPRRCEAGSSRGGRKRRWGRGLRHRARGPPGPGVAPGDLTHQLGPCVRPRPQGSHRLETRMPSEPWRVTHFGQEGNARLHLAMLEGCARGYQAAAPRCFRLAEADPHTNGWSLLGQSARPYVAGWGRSACRADHHQERTGLRLGSVVVKAVMPATRRDYDGPFAYCCIQRQRLRGMRHVAQRGRQLPGPRQASLRRI